MASLAMPFLIHFCALSSQCCGHIANSKAPLNKRKEAQKLAQWTIGQIQAKTASHAAVLAKGGKSSEKQPKEDVAALEQAFGGLEIAKAN